MKRNYFAPVMEMTDLASEGIMQQLGVATGSGAGTINNATDIE